MEWLVVFVIMIVFAYVLALMLKHQGDLHAQIQAWKTLHEEAVSTEGDTVIVPKSLSGVEDMEVVRRAAMYVDEELHLSEADIVGVHFAIVTAVIEHRNQQPGG